MLDNSSDFLDLYKSVDCFIKDAYSSNEGVTNYLQIMEKQSSIGSIYVHTWKTDYDRLRYIRGIRNRLVHDTGFNEDNIEQEDYDWLDVFRKRLFSATDPIAMLEKEKRMKQPQNVRKTLPPPQKQFNNPSVPETQQMQYNYHMFDPDDNIETKPRSLWQRIMDYLFG